jgi:hypothetical protein
MRPAIPQPTPEPASAGVVRPANKHPAPDRTFFEGLSQTACCKARGFVLFDSGKACALSLSKGAHRRFDKLRAHSPQSMMGLSALTVSIVSASAADLSGR